jgi:hypothetical protein
MDHQIEGHCTDRERLSLSIYGDRSETSVLRKEVLPHRRGFAEPPPIGLTNAVA